MIAPAQTDARDRVLRAAVEWVYDQGCATALADLEEAVCELIGRDIDGTPLKTLRGDLEQRA